MIITVSFISFCCCLCIGIGIFAICRYRKVVNDKQSMNKETIGNAEQTQDIEEDIEWNQNEGSEQGKGFQSGLNETDKEKKVETISAVINQFNTMGYDSDAASVKEKDKMDDNIGDEIAVHRVPTYTAYSNDEEDEYKVKDKISIPTVHRVVSVSIQEQDEEDVEM